MFGIPLILQHFCVILFFGKTAITEETFKMTREKTERRFTPLNGMMHFADKLGEHGDKIIYKYYGRNLEILSMSYRDFSNLVRREVAGLLACGLAGKRIAILGETSPEWVASYIAVIAAGGVAVPMDKELPISEISNFLAFGEVEAILFSRSFNAKLTDLIGRHETVKTFIPLETDGDEFRGRDEVLSFATLIASGAVYQKRGGEMPPYRQREEMSVMLFTSGTTGSSKCVMLSEKNVCAAINSACATVEFSPEDTIVSVLPIHHTYELCCMMASINYGMTVGINDTLKHVMKSFQTFKPTGLVLVPLFVTTMSKKINDEAKKSGHEMIMTAALKASKIMRAVGVDLRGSLFREVKAAFGGNLVKIICGGAPLNPELIDRFDEFGISIYEGYGITECAPLVAVTPYYRPKTGSVGPAVPSCTIRIEGETVNNRGFCEGEILVKGENVMLGYYKNEEATAAVFTENGYFRTGDVGYLDDDGYLFITGRKKSVIISDNGKNVYPEELEEYLGELSSVGECVVVGRKGQENGELVITALVYPAQELLGNMEEAEREIRAGIARINRKLPSYKQIRAVELRSTEFEKTTSRKIKRHLVK